MQRTHKYIIRIQIHYRAVVLFSSISRGGRTAFVFPSSHRCGLQKGNLGLSTQLLTIPLLMCWLQFTSFLPCHNPKKLLGISWPRLLATTPSKKHGR